MVNRSRVHGGNPSVKEVLALVSGFSEGITSLSCPPPSPKEGLRERRRRDTGHGTAKVAGTGKNRKKSATLCSNIFNSC